MSHCDGSNGRTCYSGVRVAGRTIAPERQFLGKVLNSDSEEFLPRESSYKSSDLIRDTPLEEYLDMTKQKEAKHSRSAGATEMEARRGKGVEQSCGS